MRNLLFIFVLIVQLPALAALHCGSLEKGTLIELDDVNELIRYGATPVRHFENGNLVKAGKLSAFYHSKILKPKAPGENEFEYIGEYVANNQEAAPELRIPGYIQHKPAPERPHKNLKEVLADKGVKVISLYDGTAEVIVNGKTLSCVQYSDQNSGIDAIADEVRAQR